MVIITTVIFLPAYYLLEPVMGNHGLWLAMMLFMGARGIFLSFYARKAVFGQIILNRNEFAKQDSCRLSYTGAHRYPPPAGGSQNDSATV